MKNILIIDDDEALRRSFQLQLKLKNLTVNTCATAADGLNHFRTNEYDVVFLDLSLPDKNGLKVLHEMKSISPETPVIIISGRQDMDATIEAIKSGAFDYLRKPFDLNTLDLTLTKLSHHKDHLLQEEKEAHARKEEEKPGIGRRIQNSFAKRELIGQAPSMMNILKNIGLLSRSRVPVLILGESGTGKEIVARALHRATCPDENFFAINCSAVVPTLLESELFGYEKGAFTGAEKQTKGKLEAVGAGTIFFDEIGDMPFDLQAKLLRVLQEYSFERVGGTETIGFEARPVFATNRNLFQLVEDGKFRLDLYYRIVIAQITVPPLRERSEDIKAIAEYLVTRISRNLMIPGTSEEPSEIILSDDAISLLSSYTWPGNVRELENVLSRTLALSSSNTITAEDILLEPEMNQSDTGMKEESFSSTAIPSSRKFSVEPLAEVERKYVLQSLISTSWNISQTARALKISPTTLRKKIKDYKLKKPARS